MNISFILEIKKKKEKQKKKIPKKKRKKKEIWIKNGTTYEYTL